MGAGWKGVYTGVEDKQRNKACERTRTSAWNSVLIPDKKTTPIGLDWLWHSAG
jgi:hypothetical protein